MYNLELYNFFLQLDSNHHVIHRTCTCVAQSGGACKHIYGLIHRINNDRGVSKTSVEQEWGKPSVSHLVKEVYSKGCTVAELFPQKKLDVAVPAYNLTLEDFEGWNCPLEKVFRHNNVPEEERVCFLVFEKSLEECEAATACECIEVCIMNFLNMCDSTVMYGNSETRLPNNHAECYIKFVFLEERDSLNLCIRTKNQSNSFNSEWFQARRVRITGSSKAHKNKTLSRKTGDNLVAEFLYPKPFSTAAIEYGLKKEKTGLEHYKQQYDVNVFQIGFFVSPRQPWLGVSLDGVVIKDDCLIKNDNQ